MLGNRAATRAMLLLLAFLGFSSFAAAWTKEDHEIFRLNDEVVSTEGRNVTFYSLLNIKPNANRTVINKAWRQLSVNMHPDKAYNVWLRNYDKPPKVATQAAVLLFRD